MRIVVAFTIKRFGICLATVPIWRLKKESKHQRFINLMQKLLWLCVFGGCQRLFILLY